MITRARGRGEENFQTFADGHRLPRSFRAPAKLKNQELPGRAIETASFGAIRQACHALSPWHVRRLPAVRVRCCTICTSRQVSSDGVNQGDGGWDTSSSRGCTDRVFLNVRKSHFGRIYGYHYRHIGENRQFDAL
ncbi:hypothetical protein D9M71_161000 [compost metagenome]